MLYILHPQRDEVTAILDNEKENTFWGELHVRDLRTSEDKFTFRMLGNTPASAALLPRSRILIPAETTGFNEFVLFKTSDTIKNIKTVTSIAAYTDMERSDNIISPGVYSGSLNELMEIAIPGTGYRTGHIEFSGFGTLEVKEYTKPYTFIKRLSELFDTELNFRIELKDNVIRGRYVDHLRRIGDDTDKEVSIGKDLVDAEISIDSNAVVTGLFCVGPEREDGTRLTTLVTNEAAYQRWNVNGAPKIDIYYADSNRQDMTLEELIESGTNELNARINAVYTYRLEAAMLEHLFPHERMSFGDRIRVINDKMMPALYARARIVRVERPISTKGKKIVEIGEVKTYTKDEILSKIRRVQNQFSIRVIKSPTPPPGDPRIIWVLKSTDTSGRSFEVAHTWDGSTWVPITPTKPEDVGAEPAFFEGQTPPTNPKPGTKWLDTGANPIALNIWDGTEWATIQGPQGPPGTDGIQGPKGDQGVQGPAGADGVSSYTHIAYANSADGSIGFSVSDSDSKEYIGIYVDHIPTDSNNPAMYNWTLIKGQDGTQGLPGQKGADGLTPYFHTAWANSADGTSGFSTTDSVNKLYLGTYTDFVAADSNDPTKYNWTKVKGETGDDGVTTYSWVKYADDETGSGLSDSPDGKRYIGLAFNKLTPVGSLVASNYTWSPLYDNVIVGGRNMLHDTARERTDLYSSEFIYFPIPSDIRNQMIASNPDEYTISFDIKTQVPGQVQFYTLGSIDISPTWVTLNSTTTYQRFQITFKASDRVTDGNTDMFAFYGTYGTGVIPTIKNVKLEKGNIATEWTPAPEDVDAAIANAQNTADGKNAVFYQTTQPSTAGRKVNDLWFDTDDGNRMYTFNGTTWASVQFGTNAIAQLAITNALIANGTIQDAKIASVTAAKIVANSLSAISADLGNIIAGNIQGVSILSSLFRTISALNGWVELSDGRVISADNQNNFGELRGNAIWFGNGAGNPFTGDGVNTLAFLRPLTDKSIQVDNSNGKLELGAKNTSHAHIHTDRPSVHFNKPQVTNAQETGWMAGSCINAATSANGALCGVNFRVKKTYIPSSISFDSVNSNVTPVFYDINVDGFTFGVPSMSANTLKWVRGYYTA